MKWSEEEQLKLLEVYKARPILWDPRHTDHFKKGLKEEAWNEVENEMKIPADQCRKKMVCLLSSNRRERNKTKNSLGSSEVYKSRWFAYDAMEFLRERIFPNNKTETLDGDDDEMQLQAEETEEEVPKKRSYEASNHNETSFAVPKTPKRAKKKHLRSKSSNLMASAFQLLQTATDIIAPPQEDDEITSFFKYVTTKVKTFPPGTRRSIQKAVFNILMKADEEINQWPTENGESTQFPLVQTARSPSHRSQSSMSSDDSHYLVNKC